MNYQISKDIEPYFWDTDFSKIDFKKNKEYVISRILEYGDPPAITWLFKTYSKKAIKEAFKSKRGFSRKTANFWSKVLDVDRNEILCLKKSYQKIQKAHWPY